MWLCEGGGLRQSGHAWILTMVLSLLFGEMLTLLFARLTGFHTLTGPWVMMVTVGLLSTGYGVLKKYNRQTWLYPGVLVLLFLLVMLGRKTILNGFCLFWNHMGDVWTGKTGVVLPAFQTTGSAEGISLLLVSILAGSMVALIGCVLSDYASWLLSILLMVLTVTGMLVFREDNTFLYLIPVLFTAVVLLLSAGKTGSNHSWMAAIGKVAVGVCVCGIALFIVSMQPVQDWSMQVSENLHQKIHVRRYETENTILPEGDFTDFSDNGNMDQPVMSVSMETPQEMYLRGFTGAVFEENQWKPLDAKVLAEYEDLLYWLNQNAFHPDAQMEAALSHLELEESTVTVQNLGACSRYQYVPYNVCGADWIQPENLSADGMLADDQRMHMFSVIPGGKDAVAQALESLNTTEDEQVMQYRKAESAYRSFVYEHYLQVPQEVRDMLQSYWDETAASYGTAADLTFEQAQECALLFLNRCYPDGERAEEIALPLASAEDTSYQYATTAVMTLRYFGIAARYAEGFILTEGMAAQADEENTVKLDNSCAGAWVEVYQDGLGWIPMEVTPGLEDLLLNPKEEPEEQEELELTEGEELEESPEEILEEPQSEGGYMVSVPQVIRWSGILLGLLLLLILLLIYLRHRWILKRRWKRFTAESKKEAVSWIALDCVCLMEKMGFHRGKGSLMELVTPVKEQLGDAYAQSLTAMITLNGQALFCSREMEESHREEALAFHKDTLQHLTANAKWYKKLWMQWILCLY